MLSKLSDSAVVASTVSASNCSDSTCRHVVSEKQLPERRNAKCEIIVNIVTMVFRCILPLPRVFPSTNQDNISRWRSPGEAYFPRFFCPSGIGMHINPPNLWGCFHASLLSTIIMHHAKIILAAAKKSTVISRLITLFGTSALRFDTK
jgi:hypothetical protein